jgi:hypothetical protein
MKYMLLIYTDEAATPASTEPVSPAYVAYTQAMQKAGVLVAGDRLAPSGSATTVRNRDGKSKVLDGPYAETKEQLAGYYMIEAADLDAAITWATRCPGADRGAIEVRPLYAM